MCGITGIINNSPRDCSDVLVRMTNSLKHRGPDDFGYISLNPGENILDFDLHRPPQNRAEVFLGHRRLSIIDIDGSKQPLANEDGSVWGVFNGEIYNYTELADLLKSRGHTLRYIGDTEVLVHLWEEFGEDMVDHLIGMFAFGIYDLNTNVLFMARDRYGQKPLYYYMNRNSFSFASEMQALYELDDFPVDDINNISAAHYFRYGYIPAPETIYKNVYSLMPGELLIYKSGNISKRSYWQPSVTGDIEELNLSEIEGRLDEAVKLRLRSDVPLGMFLSGGIDSALISASTVKQSESVPQTFTISTDGHWSDESNEAAITAKHLGTSHRTLKIAPDVISVSDKLARHYGQPFADFSSIPTYYISKATRKHVKVALSGDGGDELYAGYGGYVNLKYYKVAPYLPYFVKRMLSGVAEFLPSGNNGKLSDAFLSAYSTELKGENVTPLFHEHWRKEGFNEEFAESLKDNGENQLELFRKYYNEAVSADPIDKWLEVDQKLFLSNGILTKVDIASMSVSLECRAPMLDHRFAEYANKVSSKLKTHDNVTKYPLRKLAESKLPKEILDLPKKGFTVPMEQWLRCELKEWAYSLLFDSESYWMNYFSEDFVRKIWQDHQKGTFDHKARLWSLISLNLWHKNKGKVV